MADRKKQIVGGELGEMLLYSVGPISILKHLEMTFHRNKSEWCRIENCSPGKKRI